MRAVCPQDAVVGEWTPRGHAMAKMRLQMRSTRWGGESCAKPWLGSERSLCHIQPPAPHTSRDTFRASRQLCLHIGVNACHREALSASISLQLGALPAHHCIPRSPFCSEAGGRSCLCQTQPRRQAGAHLQSRDSRTHRPRGCLGDTQFLPCFYSNLDAWAGTWWVSST